ncbi:MAG: lactate racemase domain-containing protein, partial [Dehalococcoidales bacterium]
VNEEVMKCDLKIAIGSVVPHPMNGFGGGGKIILPGITSFETTRDNHISFREVARQPRDQRIVGMGIFDDNPMRRDLEEAAELSGLDMMVNCLMNAWGETTAVFAGSLKPAYAATVEAAKGHYLTPAVTSKDVVIANTYTKANEAGIGVAMAYRAVAPGGDVVLIANAPDGQVTHYLFGPFGKTTFALLGSAGRVPEHFGRLIVFTEYPDLASRSGFGESDKMIFAHNWDDVLGLLEGRGAGTSVAVYPSAEIQYCQ